MSVVIPARNEERHIEECLRSVLAFESPPGGFEVLVADGMSDDETRGIVESVAATDSRVRLIDNPGRSASSGLNSGIRAAKGELIVRVDAHSEYAPDYLVRCVEVMNETGADNVGGPTIAKAKTNCQRAIAAGFHSQFAVGGSRFHQPNYEGNADTVTYGCYRKAKLLEIGLFDEELIRNQDDELNLRLIRSGGSIYQSPRIRSWYYPRATLTQLFLQYYQYGYWKVRVIQKHGSPASIRHLVPGGFVATVILLATLAPFLYGAQLGLMFVLGIYLVAVLAASILSAARAGWDLLPIMPLVFFCYQIGYGLGFLAGIWDFLILKRSGRLTRLSRR